MSDEAPFDFESLSGRLKFELERKLIEFRQILRDIDTALGEASFAASHAELQEHRRHFLASIARLERVLPYLVERRDQAQRRTRRRSFKRP